MINGRGATPLPAVARLLLLVALLGGIVTMHAVTFTLGHDHDTQPVAASTVQHHGSAGLAAPAPCDTDDCGKQHIGLHGCVFVMTAIAAIAGLALLHWIGTRDAVLVAPKMLRTYPRRQRAPPWTVLSLHQLSILRV